MWQKSFQIKTALNADGSTVYIPSAPAHRFAFIRFSIWFSVLMRHNKQLKSINSTDT